MMTILERGSVYEKTNLFYLTFWYGSHLGNVFNFAGEKTTENLKLQPESKLLVSAIQLSGSH